MARFARRRPAVALACALAGLALPAAGGPPLGSRLGYDRSHEARASVARQVATGGALYLPLALDAADRTALAPAWPDAAVRTLIVTDLAELGARFDLAADDPEMAALGQRLATLAAHGAVAGRVVDDLREGAGPEVAAAFAAWTGNADPARWTALANALALALGDWIQRERAARHPGLRYVVLAGDDRIVPHLRLRIDAPFDRLDDGWVTETAYLAEGTVDAGTAVGTALAEDMTLTDDVYGAAATMPWGRAVRALPVPELAVGRLVERPRAMTAAIDGFLRAGGDLPIARALTACYDFMQDACAAGDQLLADAGLPDAAHRRLVGNGWTVDALRDALRDGPDLFLFGVHAKHYVHETPNNGILHAAELPALLGAADHGRLAYGLACHAGLNVPGSHPEPADFPEMLLESGFATVASTGWAYGFDGALQYQERLFAGLTARLAEGGGARLGEALVAAKRDYILAAEDLDHLHAKTLAGTVLFGLPMARVRFPGDGPRPAPSVGDAAHWDIGTAAVADAAPPYRARIRVAVDAGRLQSAAGPDGDVIVLDDSSARVQAGAPPQPQLQRRLAPRAVNGRILAPRGVVWLGARYRDLPGFHPLVRPARVLGRAAAPRAPSARFAHPGWHPAAVAALRVLPGGAPSDAVLHLSLGQLHAGTATERLYTAFELDVYYSDAADRTPPALQDVAAVPNGPGIRLSGRATDSSGIARVVAAWTLGDGRWRSRDLAPAGGDRWQADLPAGAVAVLQAVDNAGNVALADGDGRYLGASDGGAHRAGSPSTSR